MSEELETDDALWYLSFVDTTKEYREEDDYPGGPRWAGACIVPGADELDAVTRSHRLRCNPGGQVGIYGPIPQSAVKPEFVGRLLDRNEIEEAGV